MKTKMEKTGKLVICVCLILMSMGSSEAEMTTKQCCMTETAQTTMTDGGTKEAGTTLPTATTPPLDHNSTHVTSNNHTNITSTARPQPSSSTSAAFTNSAAATTSSSRHPSVSSGADHSTTATTSTSSPNKTVGTTTVTASKVTPTTPLKGGSSSSLFRSCSQLLVISVLIYSV